MRQTKILPKGTTQKEKGSLALLKFILREINPVQNHYGLLPGNRGCLNKIANPVDVGKNFDLLVSLHGK